MQFHIPQDTFSHGRRTTNLPREMSYRDAYTWMLRKHLDVSESLDNWDFVVDLISELQWWDAGRPYYNLWPAVAKSVLGFDTSRVPFESLLGAPERSIAVQFPLGGLDGIQCTTISLLTPADFGAIEKLTVSPRTRRLFKQDGVYSLVVTDQLCEWSEPRPGVREQHTRTRMINTIDLAVPLRSDDAALTPTQKLAVAVLLMERDPDLFVPDILRADEEKYRDATPERRAELVERATKRRGQRGWHVGRELETVPHYRRPHPAIRWTQKGRTVAKVVMVKGCIVKRQKLTEVPTGYYDDEEPTALTESASSPDTRK